MLIRFVSIVVCLSLSAAYDGPDDTPRDEQPPAPAAGLKPFTVAVVERKTREPVTDFSFVAGYAAPGLLSQRNKVWHRVKSPAGAVVVQAPRSCRLWVQVRTRDVLAGSITIHEFVIRSTDDRRRQVVELERGVTVHGTVRDAATRKPIAGATVIPKVYYGNPYAGIEERQAISDRDGRFNLQGIDLEAGVSAFHPDYGGIRYGVDVKKGAGTSFDIDLPPVDHGALRGTVRDQNGQPLEGVTVSDNADRVQTTPDGQYALHRMLGLPGHHDIPSLTYSKEGYVTRQFVRNDVGADGLVVTLERQVPLEGRVLGPDGLAVKKFSVCAVPLDASADYESLKSVERIVNDTGGRFSHGLAGAGKTWVSVRADGYARGEVWTDVPRSGGSLVVQLESGVSVTGKILAAPDGLVGLQARLVPRRDPNDDRGLSSRSKLQDWVALTTPVAADGTLRFDHVRPDRYTLGLFMVSADVEQGNVEAVQACQNQTTELRPLNPVGRCPLLIELRSGDGPKAMIFPVDRHSSLDRFELCGLCPGRWTIAVRSGEAVLATSGIEIAGTEPVRIELAAEAEKGQ